MQYDFDIKYKSGSTNQVADYLSRMQYDVNDFNDKVEDDSYVFVSTVFGNSMISVITMHELATCVDSDETLCNVRQYVNGEWPDKRLLDENIKPYFMVRDE